MSNLKANRRARIKKRIRKNISGTTTKPRLTVFRSNKQIYAQVIDDINGVTLISAASLKVEDASTPIPEVELNALMPTQKSPETTSSSD